MLHPSVFKRLKRTLFLSLAMTLLPATVSASFTLRLRAIAQPEAQPSLRDVKSPEKQLQKD